MTIPGIFGQRDPRYSSLELGYNTDPYYNIYHFGCAVTGAANVILWATGDWSWTPARVNQWLKDNGGFEAGGGLMIWGKLAELLSSMGIQYHGFTTDLGGTNNFLAPENNFAIAQLRGPGFPMHFSGMPFIGRIGDSWDATLKPVGTYTFVGAHLYTHVTAAPAPVVPVLSPAPAQAPVVAPLPEPVPVPVPSSEVPHEDPNDPEPVAPEVLPQPAPQPVPVSKAPKYAPDFAEFEVPTDVVAPNGSGVIDTTTNKALSKYPAGRKLTVVGYIERGGVKYLQTENLAVNMHDLGLPADDFEIYVEPVNTMDGIKAPAPAGTKPTLKETLDQTSNPFVRWLLKLLFNK